MARSPAAPPVRMIYATLEPELVDRAKAARPGASIAEIVRLALCQFIGEDPARAIRPMGRPRKTPQGN